MQIEVRSRALLGKDEVLLDVLLTPRGSGNRRAAQRIAESFRQVEKLKPFVRRIVVGSSRVRIYVAASFDFLIAIEELKREERERKDQDQLKLFGGARQLA